MDQLRRMVIEVGRREDQLDDLVVEVERDPLGVVRDLGRLDIGHGPERTTSVNRDAGMAAGTAGEDRGADDRAGRAAHPVKQTVSDIHVMHQGRAIGAGETARDEV